MNSNSKTIFLSLLLIASVFSCNKKEVTKDEPVIVPENFNSTKYIQPVNSVDVILANVHDLDLATDVYYFGSTNNLGDALKVKSISVKKNNSDTTYNFILDASFRIEYMYSSINGAKDSKLHRFEYASNDSVYFSIYNYDWTSNQDSLLYRSAVDKIDGKYNSSTVYQKTNSWMPDMQAIGSAFNIGGGVLVAVGVGIAGVAFFSAPAWLAAAGTITIANAWFGTNANAGTITDPPTAPTSISPSGGVSINPVSTSPCQSSNITFEASMDGFGSILIANPQGGFGYQYSLNGSPFQISQVFNGPYVAGSFLIQVKDANGCVKSETRKIGLTDIGYSYQGGIVAYIFQDIDPGYVAGEKHGIIIAPYDQSSSAIWGCYLNTNFQDFNGFAIGTGAQNTIDICANCSEAGIAAKLCNDLVLNGYSDWFLPSNDELEKLVLNKAYIGMNYQDSDHNYWSSSTSTGSLGAIVWNFDHVQIERNRDAPLYVRAIRLF